MSARFLYQNRIAEGSVTVTSSSEVANRPDEYLLHQARWKKWRSSTTTGDQWVRFDLGSAKSFQAIVLVDWIAHAGGTLRVQANATDVWTSPTVNELLSPTLGPTGVAVAWLSSLQTLRYVRVLFTNTGAVNAFVELGCVLVGPYFQPAFNISDGYQLARQDLSLVVKSDRGHESADTRPQPWTAEGEFFREGLADTAAFSALFTAVGIHTPFLFAIEHDNVDRILYCRNVDTFAARHVFQADFSIPVRVEESL
jgi:hypothetical protein